MDNIINVATDIYRYLFFLFSIRIFSTNCVNKYICEHNTKANKKTNKQKTNQIETKNLTNDFAILLQ